MDSKTNDKIKGGQTQKTLLKWGEFKSWEEYCKSIGSTKRVVNRWGK